MARWGATFGRTTGRDNLATLAKQTAKGPQTAWHFIVNHYVKTADGWRFMTRRFVPSEGTAAALVPQPVAPR